MISEIEKEARREAVRYARASVELEGIILPDKLLAIADQFINGDLTLEEFGVKFDLVLYQELSNK